MQNPLLGVTLADAGAFRFPNEVLCAGDRAVGELGPRTVEDLPGISHLCSFSTSSLGKGRVTAVVSWDEINVQMCEILSQNRTTVANRSANHGGLGPIPSPLEVSISSSAREENKNSLSTVLLGGWRGKFYAVNGCI